MTAQAKAPIIIKRKKVIAAGGHHGGAWKVAYADFVTAMMAFFMLMWLLNATTEQQRKGIADYFSPTIPINRVSGGGAGAFGGDNIFTEETLAQSGTGVLQPTIGNNPVRQEAELAAMQDITDVMLGTGGESMVSDNMLRHVITRQTDEGLVIELFDLPDAPLFVTGTEPAPAMIAFANVLAELFDAVENKVAINGHVAADALLRLDNPVWAMSTGRADAVRMLMEEGGLDATRIARQTGVGDRVPLVADPTAIRNNRIEIILLRSDKF